MWILTGGIEGDNDPEDWDRLGCIPIDRKSAELAS